MQEAFSFTAKSSGSLLSFLAAGTPEGHPPFSLLDGVSLYAIDGAVPPAEVPEPASLATMLTGLGLLALALRRRRQP